ncbi:MAG: DUF268 domain-containing protein [Desulfuromonadaceae bacterium]|nr:DUF268 domain-containing protein [Desulfuromonadaceae bacterium]MDD2848196.1 DUF268 domain-containing protein [Desulfuromonadaceae bacterium]MDD4130637.1 DUF268 domain-containing protein [Desulfuromonadaceae bacterium]
MKLDRITAYKKYLFDYLKFARLMKGLKNRFSMNISDRLPCLKDNVGCTPFDRHYVFHTAWAARMLARSMPLSHIDISSSLHFCTIVSAFIPVTFYDFRPAELNLLGLTSKSADILALPFANDSISSLSCMHVVEHIGLGRYGDRVDPDGDLKAISELKRVLAIGGSLLFVVPVGKPVIMFNAHRVYSYEQIVSYFSELKLEEFALIPDSPSTGGLIQNATKDMTDEQRYGCGCFYFKKVQ